MPELFDPRLRAVRRDRAARQGGDLFLLQRAIDDVLERLALIDRPFGDALLIGCPDPRWRDKLAPHARALRITDPGSLYASAAGGEELAEDRLDLKRHSLDLVVCAGTLDTIDDLPLALAGLALALRPGGLLVGFMAGGDTLPRLRSAMLAAGRAGKGAKAHVHPRIEAAALAPLLAAAGFERPVVDIDRVRIAYSSFDSLVTDLRSAAATNILRARPRTPLSRSALDQARADFAQHAEGGRTVETVEILHFAGWVPPGR